MRAILTYHSIDDSGSPISVSPAAFDRHVRWFTSGRVRVVSIDQLLTLPDDQDDAVTLTFDDGFQNARPAMEALLAEGLPLTLFVVSRHVGGANEWGGQPQSGIPSLPLLTWSDLEALARRGAVIGSHTRTHRKLTTLSGDAMDDELEGSVEDLRSALGLEVAHFAYPYGDVNVQAAARAATAYRTASTTDFRPLSAGEPLSRLPRLDMYYFRSGPLDDFGTGAFRRRAAWIGLRRQLRSRLVRERVPAPAPGSLEGSGQ